MYAMDTQLVIFDFDGTLADTHPVIIATVQQTLRELRLPVAGEAAITAAIGLPLRECYRHYLPQADEALLDVCEEVHHRAFDTQKLLHKPVLFPHVAEVLHRLRAQGIKTTIASSRTTFSLQGLLADLGVADLFDLVLGAEDVVHAKPDPEPVLQTLSRMDVAAEHTLVVGDMAVDILMGSRAGCRTCGVTFGNGSREELLVAGADAVIDDMAALPVST